MEDMIGAVKKVLSNYATLSGRATRAEFWWWQLSLLLVMIIAYFLDFLLFSASTTGDAIEPLSTFSMLAVLLPTIAVSVRRLHDIGKSGWWYLFGLVPLVGWFVLVYFFIKPSNLGENGFGEAPSWP